MVVLPYKITLHLDPQLQVFRGGEYSTTVVQCDDAAQLW